LVITFFLSVSFRIHGGVGRNDGKRPVGGGSVLAGLAARSITFWQVYGRPKAAAAATAASQSLFGLGIHLFLMRSGWVDGFFFFLVMDRRGKRRRHDQVDDGREARVVFLFAHSAVPVVGYVPSLLLARGDAESTLCAAPCIGSACELWQVDI